MSDSTSAEQPSIELLLAADRLVKAYEAFVAEASRDAEIPAAAFNYPAVQSQMIALANKHQQEHGDRIAAATRLSVYVSAAQSFTAKEGELEIDESASVSKAEDSSGAYVQSWKWIDDETAIAYLLKTFGRQALSAQQSEEDQYSDIELLSIGIDSSEGYVDVASLVHSDSMIQHDEEGVLEDLLSQSGGDAQAVYERLLAIQAWRVRNEASRPDAARPRNC